MIFFKRFFLNKIFVCYLAVAFLTLSFVSSAPAMFIPSPYEGNGTSHREADLQKIQKLLELKVVQHKLKQLGLTNEEIETRLAQLDDEQIHQIATQIQALEAGGAMHPVLVVSGIACLVALIMILIVMGIIWLWERSL